MVTETQVLWALVWWLISWEIGPAEAQEIRKDFLAEPMTEDTIHALLAMLTAMRQQKHPYTHSWPQPTALTHGAGQQ